MGRPRVKGIDLEFVRQLRRLGLGWRTVERHYYAETKQEVSFVTLRRRLMEALPYRRATMVVKVVYRNKPQPDNTHGCN
jgi:hypothetical protein